MNLCFDFRKHYEKNFLHVNKKEIIDSIRKRFIKYEEVMKPILEDRQIKYKRLEKNLFKENSEIILIGRIKQILDEGESISIDFLDNQNKGQSIIARYANKGEENMLLFQNQMVCLRGVYSEEEVSIKEFIKNESNLSSQKKVNILKSEDYFSILAFNGPYCLNESASFIGFERILEIAKHEKPSLILISGPFYSKKSKSAQLSSYTVEVKGKLTPKSFDCESSRISQINDFLSKMEEFSPKTQVVIIPDIEEIDSFYPLPLPRTTLGLKAQNRELHTYSSSPSLFKIAEDQINIGFITKDAPIDIVKRDQHKYYGDNNLKFDKIFESILEQNSMYPSPGSKPFDLSQIHNVCYERSESPDILFLSTVLRNRIISYNGSVVIGFKKCILSNSKSNGVYASVKIDSRVLDKESNVSF